MIIITITIAGCELRAQTSFSFSPEQPAAVTGVNPVTSDGFAQASLAPRWSACALSSRCLRVASRRLRCARALQH
jgi:hypothetical protein